MLLALSLCVLQSLPPAGQSGAIFPAVPQDNFVSEASNFGAKPPETKYSVRIKLPPPDSAVRLPPIAGPDDVNLPLVVLDAGHGGHDPGAISTETKAREKEVTLALARSIRDALVATGRLRVALTRDNDSFLVLQERYEIARRMKSDLFISIHADSAGNEDAEGATVYTLSEVASDKEASRLAARENKADIINGVSLADRSDEVSSILIDLAQRETLQLSADFARLLRREGEGRIDFRVNSHRFASFVVLKAPDVPSVLFEAGYLSNQKDASLLSSKQARQGMAQAVADSINLFFARRLARR